MTPRKFDRYAARRIAAGWEPGAIATACGVSRRTVYRWMADFNGLCLVRIGDQEADFVVRHGHPPRQVSDWRRAA